MKPQTLPIKTNDMERVLATFKEWGGSITTLSLKENVRIRSMSMARQETAIRECVAQGYLREAYDGIFRSLEVV
jgi:hypothetical protein